jgi:hypothetical protein
MRCRADGGSRTLEERASAREDEPTAQASGKRRRLEDREGDSETMTPRRDRVTQTARYVVSYKTLSAPHSMRGGGRDGDGALATDLRRNPSKGKDESQPKPI